MGQLPHQILKRGPRLSENGEPHKFTEMHGVFYNGVFYNVYNNIVFCTYKANLKQNQVSTQTSLLFYYFQYKLVLLDYKKSDLGLQCFLWAICLKPWDNYS